MLFGNYCDLNRAFALNFLFSRYRYLQYTGIYNKFKNLGLSRFSFPTSRLRKANWTWMTTKNLSPSTRGRKCRESSLEPTRSKGQVVSPLSSQLSGQKQQLKFNYNQLSDSEFFTASKIQKFNVLQMVLSAVPLPDQFPRSVFGSAF